MLARQRQSEILQTLEEAGAVSVSVLAERLAVAEETIRRDLAKLAGRGLVIRTHGGAVLPDNFLREETFSQRSAANAAAKKAIADAALRQVRPGSVIAIDASTTGLELAKRLPMIAGERTITVVSNGLDVVRFLAGRPGFVAIGTGGELDAAGECFVGPLAEAAIGQFAFSCAFMSCSGYDRERGPSESSLSHAAIKRAMLSAAEEAVLLVDSSKIGVRAACYVAPPERFAAIVTEERASEDEPAHAEEVARAMSG